MRITKLLPILFIILTTNIVTYADALVFSFSDPVGDQTSSSPDLTGFVMSFDNVSGNYSITVSASAANPFTGVFRINFNLLNPDTGFGNNFAQAFFSDTLNDFNLAAPATSLTLTGSNSVLTFWDAGDRVGVNHIPFGNPTGGGTAFGSGIIRVGSSPLARDEFSVIPGAVPGGGSASDFATISAIPEPSTWVLLATGLMGLGVGSVYRRSR